MLGALRDPVSSKNRYFPAAQSPGWATAGWSAGHGSDQILPLCDAPLLISSSTSFSASTANATMFADLSLRPVFKSLVKVSFSPTTARATYPLHGSRKSGRVHGTRLMDSRRNSRLSVCTLPWSGRTGSAALSNGVGGGQRSTDVLGEARNQVRVWTTVVVDVGLRPAAKGDA